MKCIICGQEITGRSKKFCSDKCSYKAWYENNKKKLSEKRKAKYIPSDRVKLTEEEKIEHHKKSVKKYLETHKEITRQRQKEYHEKHKDEEEYKKRKRDNSKKYYHTHKNDKI